MRTLLLSGAAFGVLGMPAMAADVAPAYKIPVPVPAFSWSGCYVGGDVGGAWGSQGVLDTSPVAPALPPLVPNQTPANTTATGGSVIGGGHIGCNYQWTPFLVIGVEGDYSGAGLNATGHAESLFGRVAAPGGGITWSSRLDSIATVRGRVGFAWTPNTLVYLTGGGAWGRTSYSSTDVFFFGCPNCATTSFSNTSSGYVLGGGLEWAPWSNTGSSGENTSTTTSAVRQEAGSCPGLGSWRRIPLGATWRCHRVGSA
jgi:outer membrane immunogenic protein